MSEENIPEEDELLYHKQEKEAALVEVLYWVERLVIEDDASSALKEMYLEEVRRAWHKWKKCPEHSVL